MTITLHDPVRPLDHRPRPPRPEDNAVGDRGTLLPFRDELRQRPAMRVPARAPADDVRAALRRGGTTSFELASRGGYARTVTGWVAFLDEDAQTYMVLGDDDELLRVPFREITSMQGPAISA